jgi:hypothetical protein
VQRETAVKLVVVGELPRECEAEFETTGGAHEVIINIDPEKSPLRTGCDYGDFSNFPSAVLTSQCRPHSGERY